MSRAKHTKNSWRTMKEWTKTEQKMSKMCKKCLKECKHMSVGELTYCVFMEPKNADIR